ncbi:glycosyl hydrolase family 71-domain-containing protein [Aspergillus arachidicola]|uniref:Glycosyl hydrolase family 71-domain-containing protein n=1 Tax=Aspergillus arachidicola TaxID=656916 RepID=A0A5N6XNS4_9EURO|nr:glycosyl hydrolase family 71-domain-containing protein [Aspergillus arachidicola]
MRLKTVPLLLVGLLVLVAATPAPQDIGITSNRQSAADIGVDSYVDTQLDLAYESAAQNDMKVVLSFDFNWYHTEQISAVGAKINQYSNRPARLMVDNKIIASYFGGDGLDLTALHSATGGDIFFAPNFHPSIGDFDSIQGALNWMAWDNTSKNQASALEYNVTVTHGDKAYVDALKGKSYIARRSHL